MKTITQERLIKTIENINARLHKKIYREEKIVGYAVELGLKVACNSAFNKPTPQSDRDKFALELDFINASKDPDQLRLARERMVYQIHRFGDKRCKVYEIQKHHKITSLIPTETQLGDRTITHLWQDEYLPLQEYDIPALHEDKIKLTQLWVDYVTENNLTVYAIGKEDNWELSDAKTAIAALPFYEWASVWEEVSYYSSAELNATGFADSRKSPLPDDTKDWRVNLSLGRGLYTSSIETPRIELCACNIIPSD